MDNREYSIELATEDHIERMRDMVRPADADELWASSMMTPDRVMKRALGISDFALTGFVNDLPVCMWGVVTSSIIGNIGTPWMVATKHLDRYAIPFLRFSKPQVMSLLDDYDMLRNYVDTRNTRAIQWLKWLGFKVEEKTEPYGMFKMPFHKFVMEKAHV